MESYQTISHQYRALKEAAATGAVAARGAIGLQGKDRATFLHGLLTNDILALGAGTGCYAAWLTPQGRMTLDLHVLESGDMMLLDVPASLVGATLRRLDQVIFNEDVQVTDLSAALRPVWIHGPEAAAMLALVLPASAVADWPEYRNGRFAFGEGHVVVARISQLGVPGYCVYVESEGEQELRDALQAAGAVPADPPAVEAARIEAGYPVFGIDMTEDTIPLEAGIEARAISFTKGCYVGQEVIIRVLHRGHGRVVRKLVSLRVSGAVPVRGAKLLSDDREIGAVTSAAESPRLGSIALGYVHRDFVEPGTTVDVETAGGRTAAVVSERPIA